jgi:hypothetical protein
MGMTVPPLYDFIDITWHVGVHFGPQPSSLGDHYVQNGMHGRKSAARSSHHT